MKNYTQIFNTYVTDEGQPFYMINRSIVFPDDDQLDIYDTYFNQDDTPWTVLSYILYGDISYWWVLSSLNKDMVFYAERGKEIRIIYPEKIKEVLSKIQY